MPILAQAGYISFALSRDDEMGDDSVIECVVENGIVRSYTSWNIPRPSLGNTRLDVVSKKKMAKRNRKSCIRHDLSFQQQNIITHINSSYIDGKIYCKVKREKATMVLGHEFNLGWHDFYFMLAMGTGFTGIHSYYYQYKQELFPRFPFSFQKVLFRCTIWIALCLREYLCYPEEEVPLRM